MARSMKNPEIQGQHAEREKVEENPEIEQIKVPIVNCQCQLKTSGSGGPNGSWQLEIENPSTSVFRVSR
jgi:hypothetical protein